MSEFEKSLADLKRHELIHLVEELQEERRMARAFSNLSESGANDATLQWRGRNRFLAEKIIPVSLKPVPDFSLHSEKGEHRIIDGDNLSVMASLLTEFRGGPTRGVDVIYLDPPYNTGEDVFAYKDDYFIGKARVDELRLRNGRAPVSLDDPSRHTKWINHMAPRLWAARKLLKGTGVIIVSIDEHELPRLWMLMEEMFGEKNRVATLIWERSRKNDAKYVSEGHEYMLVWARDKAQLDARASALASTPEWKNEKGRWRKRKDGVDAILTAYGEAKAEHGDDIAAIQSALDAFFKELPKDHPAKKNNYRKIDENGIYRDGGDISWPGGGGPRYEVLHPITGKPCKIPSSGWRYGEETMKELIAEGRVYFGATHNKIPSQIYRLDDMENEVQRSVITRDGRNAVDVITAVLGKGEFKNPKDHEMLAELFNLVTWRDKNAVILDAYAGSGTTAHAVLAMNAEDGGNRRFLLIENGIPSAKSKVARDRYVPDITGNWADGKEHPPHETGFTFYRAGGKITKRNIMESTRESLADIILQVVEEESNRIDCRVEGHDFLIGRTRLGYGIALAWDINKTSTTEQVLTHPILEKILDEAEASGVQKPVHVYATANAAPLSDDLYRFHQIPDSILARLGILEGDDDE